jgi:hypothetical protein
VTAGPRIDSYQWSGGREAMLRFGPEGGPVLVAALPLLEEANRTRAFVVTILRALAQRGIGGVLPDLPGTGESLVATERMRLANLRAAFAAAARASGERVFALAVRSGDLLDGEAELRGRWHLAPQIGAEALREWRRVAGADTMEVAGNLLSREFLGELALPPDHSAEPRVVRLRSDPRPANLKVGGAPLWRRAEPENDPQLAQLLAADIAEWIATCGG